MVAVGRRIEDRTEGGRRISRWTSEEPIRVAGFNFGRFKTLEKADEASGITVRVYTNPGTPDVIKEINEALRAALSTEQVGNPTPTDTDIGPAQLPQYVGPRELNVSTQSLAEAALADAINMSRLGKVYFGPLPQTTVAITQQSQWFFGQSWPTLIYLPYLAFIDGTTRMQLGLTSATDFVNQVGPHEMAHQWWGHLVGAESYRDDWLSEGFAEFAAALLAEQAGGQRAYHAFLERARRAILARPQGAAAANFEVGPMTQGFRLAMGRSGNAYSAMVYSKGAYVLHMLRTSMRDPSSTVPDAAFVALLRDFAASFAGKEPSTDDFQKVVERHMAPALNATGDGKADWFFRQWVHGIEIPRYEARLTVKEAGAGVYRIQGTITQADVSAGFRALVPIYVEFGKGELARIGVLPFVGPKTIPVEVEVPLPRKPKRALVNALHDVLARD